jgi:hypothetical protein
MEIIHILSVIFAPKFGGYFAKYHHKFLLDKSLVQGLM